MSLAGLIGNHEGKLAFPEDSSFSTGRLILRLVGGPSHGTRGKTGCSALISDFTADINGEAFRTFQHYVEPHA